LPVLSLDLKYYPIFLDLKDKPVLVVGAGKIALRKTRGLVEAGARVTVVAPEWEPEFESLPVKIVARRFRATDINNMCLIFAATDDRLANHRAAVAAKGRSTLVNVADSQPECDFIVPARVSKGSLQVAISTSGENPRVSAELRRKLEDIL
jgi:precorrin-2 dehydrogenase / sirohydrochlorin ferrochelatase